MKGHISLTMPFIIESWKGYRMLGHRAICAWLELLGEGRSYCSKPPEGGSGTPGGLPQTANKIK